MLLIYTSAEKTAPKTKVTVTSTEKSPTETKSESKRAILPHGSFKKTAKRKNGAAHPEIRLFTVGVSMIKL